MYSSKASHFLFPLSFSGKTTHRFTIQSDVQTITISCMSSVYQLRSSEDQSSFSSSPLLVYSPHLGLSGLEETEPWVWGLEYLSAGGQIKDHSYSVSVCMCVLCVYFFKLFFIIANLSSCHCSNLVSGSNSLQEYPIFTAVSTTTNKGAGVRGGKRENPL